MGGEAQHRRKLCQQQFRDSLSFSVNPYASSVDPLSVHLTIGTKLCVEARSMTEPEMQPPNLEEPTDESPPVPALIRRLQAIEQKAKARQAEQETNKPPPQLPLWGDELRGLPNSLARGALFTAGKSGAEDREFLQNQVIASQANIHIVFSGQELRQDDASVFMTLLHMARDRPLGEPIRFTAYSMLKELGWSINSDGYKALRECCDRLKVTSLTVRKSDATAGYSGSLVRSFEWVDTDGAQMSRWQVYMEPKITALFGDTAYTLLSWQERKQIGGRSTLALWLHSFLGTHRDPFPISVNRYYELSKSKTKNLSDFKSRLGKALQRLVEVGFLESYKIDGGLVHVKRNPATTTLRDAALRERLASEH